MAIIAAILIIALAIASPATSELTHIPIFRKDMHFSKVFDHGKRPWAAQIPNLHESSGLHVPLKLTDSHVRGSQLFHGSIVPLGEYYITLLFGGQPLNVQIDTGSSTMAVPLKKCSNCRAGNHRLDLKNGKGNRGLVSCESSICRPNSCHFTSSCSVCSSRSRACCSSMDHDSCGFSLRYADKSGVQGALAHADVTLAGYTVPLVFGAVLSESARFEAENVEGIFGLAYPALACNPTCVSPLFDVIVSRYKETRDIFSICTGQKGGALILGGSNSKLFSGEMQYVPLVTSSRRLFYSVEVKGLSVNGENLDLPHFSQAIIDSGTTLIVIPKPAYVIIRKFFQSHYCQVPGLCVKGSTQRTHDADVIRKDSIRADLHINDTMRANPNTWFRPGFCARLAPSHVKMLPVLSFKLNGVVLELEPEEYMLVYEEKSKIPFQPPKVYRCLGIGFLAGLKSHENNVIMGNTALRKYYVEYDRENSRMGFAEAKDCHDPSAMEFPGKQSGGKAPAKKHSSVSFIPSWIVRGLLIASVGVWIFILIICALDARRRQSNEYREIESS